MLYSVSNGLYIDMVVWIILFLLCFVVHSITTLYEIYTGTSLSPIYLILFLQNTPKNICDVMA